MDETAEPLDIGSLEMEVRYLAGRLDEALSRLEELEQALAIAGAVLTAAAKPPDTPPAAPA